MKLKLPGDLHHILKIQAVTNCRSLNGEIQFRLLRDLQNEKDAAGTAIPPRHELAETHEGNSND